MKKVFKIIGLTILGLLGLIIIVCLGIIINGSCFATYDNDGKDYSSWMANIKDETLVNEIVMPGSHDAGSYGMVWLGETQQFNIDEQLQMGVRYFDLRVNKVEDKYVDIKCTDTVGKKIFFELKTAQTVKSAIREALGQLLEYNHYPNESNADKLIIVTKHEPEKEDIQYLTGLRMVYNIPVYYQYFDMNKKELSKMY